jgi:NAD(P)H dehydrogenase (quinone)
MMLLGVPYTEPALTKTRTGGTPYGASHVTFNREDDALSDDERLLAHALGRRVAGVALRLEASA